MITLLHETKPLVHSHRFNGSIIVQIDSFVFWKLLRTATGPEQVFDIARGIPIEPVQTVGDAEELFTLYRRGKGLCCRRGATAKISRTPW